MSRSTRRQAGVQVPCTADMDLDRLQAEPSFISTNVGSQLCCVTVST